MKYNKKQPKDFIHFDTSKTYACPMIRSDSKYPNEIEDIVEVKLVEDSLGYFVDSIQPGYERKYFYDKYLDYLFHRNYIKEI